MTCCTDQPTAMPGKLGPNGNSAIQLGLTGTAKLGLDGDGNGCPQRQMSYFFFMQVRAFPP